MSKSITSALYVGMDVHKDSIDIAVADAGRDGEVRHVGSIGGDLASLAKALRNRARRNHDRSLRHHHLPGHRATTSAVARKQSAAADRAWSVSITLRHLAARRLSAALPRTTD